MVDLPTGSQQFGASPPHQYRQHGLAISALARPSSRQAIVSSASPKITSAPTGDPSSRSAASGKRQRLSGCACGHYHPSAAHLPAQRRPRHRATGIGGRASDLRHANTAPGVESEREDQCSCPVAFRWARSDSRPGRSSGYRSRFRPGRGAPTNRRARNPSRHTAIARPTLPAAGVARSLAHSRPAQRQRQSFAVASASSVAVAPRRQPCPVRVNLSQTQISQVDQRFTAPARPAGYGCRQPKAA